MEPNLFRYIWQHSRRDQILVLVLILLSLPFYFASFDVPKRIINDALQGRAFAAGQTTTTFLHIELGLPSYLGGYSFVLLPGFQVDRMQLLFGLSGIFLGLVLINGAFKYVINVAKGILGERLLRRMRYELFALLLRFRPEDIRGVKPAEAASIIKDEVEPIGGFSGDAFIQPVFLGMQAFTAMLFIMVQSVWLGLVALAIVLVQAFVIPRLRREQLRLARERQIASRQLAGRIGEIVEGAPAIHTHGAVPFTQSEIGYRLGDLFKIRVDLFRRKFAVKYLNNFLASVTPFFFYAIGGYFALKGVLDIGQLVAVIAAYRDLPPPIKELIDWDQERADVTIKYQQIVMQYPSDRLLRDATEPDAPPEPDAPIRIEGVRVTDSRGTALLDSMSEVIERPAHVALVGGAGSGRDILARVLGRQLADYQGKVTIGNAALRELSDHSASRVITYAGQDPLLFSGTVRDNVVLSLRRIMPMLDAAPDSSAERLRRLEAERSGNPLVMASDDWIDYRAAGLETCDRLDSEIVRVLNLTGFGAEIHRLGLLGRIDVASEPHTVARLLEARRLIATRLSGSGEKSQLIAEFNPATYNDHATIAENLLFGLSTSERFAGGNLAVDEYARSILEAEALLLPLARIGLRMAETVLEVFADLPPGHPLFERYSFIRQDELPEFQRLVEQAGKAVDLEHLPLSGQARLIGLALTYIEPEHRLLLIDKLLKDRVVRARRSFRDYLPAAFAPDVAFYDPEHYNAAASIRDNLLFGRVVHGKANAEAKVAAALDAALVELDLARDIDRIGLDTDVGPGGKQLFATQRASVALARCLLSRPEVLVLDGAFGAFGASEARRLLAAVRGAMTGRTLIVTLSDAAEAKGFDLVLKFDGSRYLADTAGLRTVTKERAAGLVPAGL